MFPVYPVELIVAYAGATSPDDPDDADGVGTSFGFGGGLIPAGNVPWVGPEAAGLGFGAGGGAGLVSSCLAGCGCGTYSSAACAPFAFHVDDGFDVELEDSW